VDATDFGEIGLRLADPRIRLKSTSILKSSKLQKGGCLAAAHLRSSINNALVARKELPDP
jgi:hypothetical protein